MQPLLVVERRLHSLVGCARQDPLCERQNALHVEFLDSICVVVDLGQRQLLAPLVALPRVGRRIDTAAGSDSARSGRNGPSPSSR